MKTPPSLPYGKSTSPYRGGILGEGFGERNDTLAVPYEAH